MELVILYTIFAVISILVNFAGQMASEWAYSGPLYKYLALAAGTGAGLVVKYVLDKKYIFKYRTGGLSHDTRLFVLYTAMGLVTTAIFWGFELGFDYVYKTRGMRYLGGAIGLVIGYITKYRLDKRYVFRS